MVTATSRGNIYKVHLQLNGGFLGTFLKTITPDPTWAYVLNVTDINNVTGRIAETFRFCDGLQVIEQPNGRKNTCPPEKGGGMISVLAYVLSGEFEPVSSSLLLGGRESQADEGNRETILCESTQRRRRMKGYTVYMQTFLWIMRRVRGLEM